MANIYNLLKNGSAAVLKELDPQQISTLRYPTTLGQTDQASIPYVIFAPYKKKAGLDGFYSANPSAVLDKLPDPRFAVVLPLPSSALKTSYGVAYDNYDLGGVAGNLLTGLKDVTSTLADRESLGTPLAIAEALKKMILETPGKAAVNGLYDTFKAAADQVSSGSAIDTAAGMTQNPFTETIFKNVEPRSHTFTYTFIPKTEKESEIVDSIIQLFKFYMLPAHTSFTSDQSGFFSFPYEFQITYSVSDTTFTLLPSVLKSFEVDYANGTDTPHFYKASNRPVAITISMTFTEVMLMNRNQIKPGNSSSVDLNEEVTATPTFTRFRF